MSADTQTTGTGLPRVLCCCLALLLCWPVIAAAGTQVLVESGTAMRHLANNADPGLGISWTAEGFNDAAWSGGSYGVGYETRIGTPNADNLLQTTVPSDTQSVYTRTTFEIENVAAVSRVLLGMDYDDGVVAWVNGVEVYRSANMPAGEPDWINTLSFERESSNGTSPDYSPLQDITADALPVLHNGTNVLAIGVWNKAPLPSSDLVLVPQLSIEVATASPVLVGFGSPMRYQAINSNPGLGISWAAEGFDDAAWLNGSYGAGYEARTGAPVASSLLQTTVPSDTQTVYTRASFEIADMGSINNVYFGVDYDDGVVAWVNGVEVYRSANMPTGPPDWNTLPLAQHESSNGSSPDYDPLQDITAAALPVLNVGTNVLAVGAWNTALPSSDLVLVPRLSVNEESPTLERGPYLQSGTPTSMVVRWRTSLGSSSRVEFGDAPGNLAASVEDATSTTEHEITLTGLTPDTRYYYSVGTTTGILAGGDAGHFFVTPPLPGTAMPTRVWVLGDSGTANTDAQNVANAYSNYTGATQTDLWLMLGDNAYNDGTDSQYQAAVFDMYPAMLRTSVLWPTLGNHDGNSADSASQTGVYYDIFTLPTGGEAGGLASGTEAYYSFDYGNIHFICLDSHDSDRSVGGAMLSWLAQDIAQTTQEWIIAYWHHPPYSKGSHDSDTETQLIEMRENALPILEAGGVDLVLAGHSHSYERSFLLDGHYDVSSTLTPAMLVDGGDGRPAGDGAYKRIFDEGNPYVGAVYTVAGSSGKVGAGAGDLNHPAMYLSLEKLGSLVLDVDGNRLDATFIDDAGSILDTFTIEKNPDNCPLVQNPDQLDSDGDGVGDACDTDGDDDGDGLDNAFEQSIGTNPSLPDTDGDGLTDFDEVNYDGDSDNYTPGQDLNPLSTDTDSDGIADGSDPMPLVVNAGDGDLAPWGAPDGIVNAADILIAQQIVLGLREATGIELAHGDLYPPGTPDGVIDMSDLILILKLVQPPGL